METEEDNSHLEKIDFMRYGRQMLVEAIGVQGQEKIKAARVLVIGAGGLGCPVLQYLAATGVGTVGVVDFDRIEIHNLHRQILYNENHIGARKVDVAREVLQRLNPHSRFHCKDVQLTEDNAVALMTGYDLIIDGSDNFNTRYLVNDTCVALGLPLVYGSIFNFEAQFSVFNHQGGKNLRDLFAQPPNPELVPNCAMNGVLGTLPGLLAVMMAQEALKVIIGLPVLHNEYILWDTLSWEMTKLSF